MTGFGKNLVKISICLTCGGFYGFEFNWGFFEGFVHSEYLDREILANSVIIRLGFTLFINKLRTASLGLTMSTTWIRIQLSRLFRTDLCSAFDQDILENIQILRWKIDWAIPREIESFVVEREWMHDLILWSTSHWHQWWDQHRNTQLERLNLNKTRKSKKRGLTSSWRSKTRYEPSSSSPSSFTTFYASDSTVCSTRFSESFAISFPMSI